MNTTTLNMTTLDGGNVIIVWCIPAGIIIRKTAIKALMKKGEEE